MYRKRLLKQLIWIMMSVCPFFVFAQSAQDKVMSTTIEFIVNTDIIIENSHYFYYIDSIVPYIKENPGDVSYVLIVGSASPEGRTDNNIRLSNCRADKVHSYISRYVPESRISKTSDYNLFLSKTSANADDYPGLRATYVEVGFSANVPETIIDTVTVYRDRILTDTVYLTQDVLYRTPDSKTKKKKEYALSLYNDIVGDLNIRRNIGLELYFRKASFFIEGSFSQDNLYDMKYDIQIWHTGFRKYFVDDFESWFIEGYCRTGFFDTTVMDPSGDFGVFWGVGLGLGYKFDIGKHWKIYPIFRIGFDYCMGEKYSYRIRNGNINVLFDGYTDGKSSTSSSQSGSIGVSSGTQNTYTISRKIDEDFYNNSKKTLSFGPAYIGVVIQRDFFKRKHNK